jgi:two-component system, chemotaxis family, sensor kinase CheA
MSGDPYKYFRIEARELVDQLAREALELDKQPDAPERVALMLRLAHTLKGAARVVKQAAIAERAHAIEDALAPFRTGGALTRECVDRLLKWTDEIGEGVEALSEPKPVAQTSGQPVPVEERTRTLRADLAEVDALLDGLGEAGVLSAGLSSDLAGLERVQELARRIGEPLRSGGDARALSSELENLSGRLRRELATRAEQLERELRQLRDTGERLRLIPVERIFQPLERTLRDAATSLGRRVRFEARGGDVRLDADVLDAVQAALVQAVRNAVAHGIESEEERASLGKPREGRVQLEVTRSAGRVTFRCRDDGRGVDLASVRRAAEQRGMSAVDAGALDTEPLLERLLQGGISTAAAVTEIAGRGVGLDVARDTARRLGGRVGIQTEPGRGTALELIVPISLAALPALLVEVGGRVAAIPLDAVRRTLRVATQDLARSARQHGLPFEGCVIPFVPLGRALRADVRPLRSAAFWSVVVLESGGSRAALGVDRLCGVETVVVRALPAGTPVDPVVSGASLDAAGNPQLVLDPACVLASALGAEVEAEEAARPPRRVLVIDDSLTTRMLEQSVLEAAGYEVDLAASAEEGLEKAQRSAYALFLVDLEMPGMNGFEFIARTRADAALREIPAVMMTSRSAPEDRRRGLAAGASDYFVKSEFDQNVLLARIRELVGA